MSWGIVRLPEQWALVFSYVDPSAGPSAKGALLLSEQPSLDEARAAVKSPAVTVRLAGLSVRALPAEEVARLQLPAEPQWLSYFRPKGPGPWASDPLLAGKFHPTYRNDLETGFLFIEHKAVEQMWVRLDATVSELKAWEGILLNTADCEPTMSAGTRVKVRGAVGAPGPVWLSPVMEENFRTWEATCTACGFDLVLEPIATLITRQFPDAPPDSQFEGLTTRCAMCEQTQMLKRRPTRLEPAPLPPPAPEPEPPPTPRDVRGPAIVIVVLALIALLGIAWALFVD